MKTLYITILIISYHSNLFSQSNWQWQNPLPQGNSLFSTFFTDNNTGYSVGINGTIIKTTNGGIDWVSQISPERSFYRSVYFISPLTGWAAGVAGTIVKTTNGGINWNLQSSNTSTNLKSIFFTSADSGWVVGESGIVLKTSNGEINLEYSKCRIK